MENGIGAILREARKRRKLDVAQVEEATKIRARYLRAMENEEWDLLPGGIYTRSFIRTYAGYLGLDGERLADELRRSLEPARGERRAAIEPARPASSRRGGPRLSRRAWGALVAVGLIVLLVIVGLSGGGDESSSPSGRGHAHKRHAQGQAAEARSPRGLTLRIAATAEVWVCLLDEQGQPLIDGQILSAGASEGPFHSDSFTVAFGNGAVDMEVNGKAADVPETASPIGYTVTPGGELEPLANGERPTCT